LRCAGRVSREAYERSPSRSAGCGRAARTRARRDRALTQAPWAWVG
jgi:hypothetical protein